MMPVILAEGGRPAVRPRLRTPDQRQEQFLDRSTH